MPMDVTVIIPVHNTGRGVLEGLESLRAQTLPRSRFEVIYVDDGSTDETGALLDAELADEENFSVVHIENSGWPGRPRNIGMDRARGEFLFFVDDDDHLGAEALERLVAKAREDSADIVIGRMAGIGRKAPRELFQKPLSGATLRTHRVLLSTLTVHKLFRTEFVRANGLRFPEGKVRLEDHMFMLPAYLRARSISVVHDYTCYYWVRHKNFGNISFATPDFKDYLGSVERIFDIIEAETEPGEFQDALIAQWYRGKVLGQFQGAKYLNLPPEAVDTLHSEAYSLAERRVPERLDAKLNPFARLRAAALRSGNFVLIRQITEFELDLTHRVTVNGYRWDGTTLYVDIESALVRKSTKQPLEFVRSGDSVYWDLPSEALADSRVRAAAEISAPLRKIKLQTFARCKEIGADVTVPTSFTSTEEPTGQDRFTIRLTGTVKLDLTRANLGSPLLGSWWFVSRVEYCGISCDQIPGPNRSPEAEAGCVPALVHLDEETSVLATTTYNRKEHLVLTVDPSWKELASLVPRNERPALVRESDSLRLRVPLSLYTGGEENSLSLRLVSEGTSVESTGSVQPTDAARPRAVLTAEIPSVPRRGRWQVAVGSADHPVPLPIHLSRGLVRWSVTVQRPPRLRTFARRVYRALRRRAGRVYRALRRRAGRVARAVGLRR